jgi:hypothetical protein
MEKGLLRKERDSVLCKQEMSEVKEVELVGQAGEQSAVWN